MRHWKWVVLAGLAALLPALLLGIFRFKTGYSVTVQLIRREVTATLHASQLGEAFKPRQVSVATVVNVMLSPKLLDRIGSLAKPPLTGRQLRSLLTIKPERDTDLITITFTDKNSPQATAELVNLFAAEVVALTARMQSDEAAELDRFLMGQIEQLDSDLKKVNLELLEFSRSSEFYAADREVEAYLRQLSDLEIRLETARANFKAADFRIASFERELAKQSREVLALDKARDSLAALRISYASENPIIKDAQDKVSALEKQLTELPPPGTNSIDKFRYSENTVANDLYVRLLTMRAEREASTRELAQIDEFRTRVQEKLKGVPEKGQRYAQIISRQRSLQEAHDMLAGRQREAQVYKESSPGLYRLFSKASEETVEKSSRWKKIIIVALAALVFGMGVSLTLVWGLELLDLRVVSIGDLKRATGVRVTMSLPDTMGWDSRDIVQWRFRAWSMLLRQLDLRNAKRVTLAFASANSGEGKSTLIGHFCAASNDRQMPVVAVTNAASEMDAAKSLPLADALAAPEWVVRHLREHRGVPLQLRWDRTWNWDLANRERWRQAVEAWRSIPALVLLVELPPMADLDAVFAAESMPAVVWVAASGQSQQRDLAKTLEVVEAADVVLVAAVLNREPPSISALASLRRFGLLALVLICSSQALADDASATNASAPVEQPPFSQTPKLAAWQERFEVGAGDIFHLRIYGRTDSVRIYVPVGPDGCISFLEAQSLRVAGLTVDEMRATLDRSLSRYYTNVRTVVTPVEWHSKKYYLLGAVVDRGAYTLDRPLTIIEAVSRARGIASGLFEHNTVELADMSRSFIVRNGQRLQIDFNKLFNHGDLSQNILIEPGDYLYFPSGTVNEVYVLGAVRNPGPLGLTSENTLMGVIAVRGGFSPSAYKQRILVVRGSLDKPQTFAVNVAAILAGKEKDFELKPKDIIYVAVRPWQRVEELSQLAINAFAQSMTASWVGNNIQPLTSPNLMPRP
jgi:protein involved in polysaccharide export with SLBB domain/uncharacterized protein involved in exopolysaccharide biosynthesis